MKLAVIPARGGSKRIPKKNIKDFYGKPMIAWSIETAISSGLFDEIIVSTDDKDIADIARAYGAKVPFVRPNEISDDYTGTTPVIAHATQWAISQGYELDAVCCIYATSPFIQNDDLKRGWDMLHTADWDYSFTASEYAAPIFRSFKQTSEGGVEMFFSEEFDTRSQDLTTALHDAGQFYWGRPSSWLEEKRIFSRRSVPIIIPKWRVQDIDTNDDWYRAELLKKVIETKGQCK
jgi:pseudaminic acid cytidylyltransferase